MKRHHELVHSCLLNPLAGSTKYSHLCYSFFLTLFPCFTVASFPWAAVLHALLQHGPQSSRNRLLQVIAPARRPASLWTSVGCRGTAYPTTVFSRGRRGISALVPGAPPPAPYSLTLGSAAVPFACVSLFSPTAATQCFLCFLKHVLAEAPPPWPPSSAAPGHGPAGAIRNRLESAVPGMGQPRPPLREGPAAPWTPSAASTHREEKPGGGGRRCVSPCLSSNQGSKG